MNTCFVIKALCIGTLWSGVALLRTEKFRRESVSRISTRNGWENRWILQPLTISFRYLGVTDAVNTHLKNVPLSVSLTTIYQITMQEAYLCNSYTRGMSSVVSD